MDFYNNCAASLRQNGIQEYNRFSDSEEATKKYCEEMKETLSLPGCSFTRLNCGLALSCYLRKVRTLFSAHC